MGHCRPKSKANKESKGVNGKPINPKDENAEIGSGKPNEVSKSPWEYGFSKRDKEAQRKQMGQGCPREKQKGHRSP